MKLKFKLIKLEAGRPIAFISKDFADRNGIFKGGRIEVFYKGRRTIIIADVVEKMLKDNEIALSEEAMSFLKVRGEEEVDVSIALEPESVRYILKKLEGKTLNKEEIFSIINDIANNALNEAEIAYFVSGVYHCSMSFEETVYLTDAVAKTGKIIKWSEDVADKHSIGGIAGNRTTPIIVSICASLGVKMPKTSSRAITSAAGTADVLETVTNVELSVEKLKQVVEKTNGCFAWGGSLGLAPADDKLIRVERMLNVDPEPQLLASILAKKISVGSKYILIDIPCGNGAKVSVGEAKNLSKKFIKIGKRFNLKIKVVLTKGNEPIGNGIGPALEMIDVLKVLNRNNPPRDLEEKSIYIASEILEMVGKAKKDHGKDLARETLNSGRALKKFNEIICAQGKKNIELKTAKFSFDVKAERNGKVKRIDNKDINLIAKVLGCPNNIGSGIYLYKHIGDKVKKGEKILTLYSESRRKLNEGLRYYKEGSVVKI